MWRLLFNGKANNQITQFVQVVVHYWSAALLNPGYLAAGRANDLIDPATGLSYQRPSPYRYEANNCYAWIFQNTLTQKHAYFFCRFSAPAIFWLRGTMPKRPKLLLASLTQFLLMKSKHGAASALHSVLIGLTTARQNFHLIIRASFGDARLGLIDSCRCRFVASV